MITEDRLMLALKYLAETDEPAAKARAVLESLVDQRKTVKACGFLEAEGTQEKRVSEAYTSSEYVSHINRIKEATYDYELMRNKRKTEELIVDVFRSLNANRRAGNIV